VTDSTTPLDGLRPHRLTTFGALSLAGPDGDVVLGEHGHHRRRLALLAVLAASGDRGRSRDQLLPLFWPEVTQSRARHSLDQLLYALRSSIGDSLFAGANPVRLDPGVMSSDVGDFNAAVERGDARAAVEAYRGPFLDGFFLSDAPEFERWVESERSRFATSYASALERLARNADAAGEHRPLVYVLGTCGLRFGEVAELRWRDLNLETNRISRSVTLVDGEFVVGSPKNGKGRT